MDKKQINQKTLYNGKDPGGKRMYQGAGIVSTKVLRQKQTEAASLSLGFASVN